MIARSLRILLCIAALGLAGCSAKIKGGAEVNSGGMGGAGGEGGASGGTGGTTGGAGGASGGAGGTTGGRGGTGGTAGVTGGMGGDGGNMPPVDSGMPDAEIDAGPPMNGMLPLPDLANGGLYMDEFEGGLYPNSRNTPPAQHHAAGIELARSVVPLNAAGEPAANGKVVLLSIGMSNATQAFCNPFPSGMCPPQSFVAQALADDDVNDTTLVMVDGAAGGQVTMGWDDVNDSNYNRVRDERLEPNGVTEAQVQVIWMKNARGGPTVGLPAADAEAYGFETDWGNTVRVLEARYPNLKMVFLTSRSYAGWASTPLNPEPYAYEYGFAVKWLIEAQINQVASNDMSDTRAGALDYRDDTAPWLAWGPYLWAAGETPRAYDGFSYEMSDYGDDGTHPSIEGQRKIGGQLLQFFKTSPYTRCWFLAAAPECE